MFRFQYPSALSIFKKCRFEHNKVDILYRDHDNLKTIYQEESSKRKLNLSINMRWHKTLQFFLQEQTKYYCVIWNCAGKHKSHPSCNSWKIKSVHDWFASHAGYLQAIVSTAVRNAYSIACRVLRSPVSLNTESQEVWCKYTDLK